MNSISTNILSISAQRSVGQAGSALSTSMERLSSGLRINSAKDDAAGLGISERMTSQVRGLSQAIRNSNDGISMMQTAEGALQESTNIMQRMRELAVQSANDTNSASDRSNLQKEVSQLQEELNRIASSTSFNGKNLLDGSLNNAKFHIGHESGQTINVSIGDARSTSMGTNRVSLGGAAGTYLKAAKGTVNGIVAEKLTVAGSSGSEVVNVSKSDSARTIAEAVNAKTGSTNVSASAQTIAVIDTISKAGTIAFDLEGQNEGDAIRVSAQVTDTTDLSDLAKSINDVAGKTGVRAVLSDDKSQIMLENSDGYDISVVNQSANETFNLSMAKVSGDFAEGEDVFSAGSILGAAQTVAKAGGEATVAGTVEFDSANSFSVLGEGTLAQAATTASTLEDIGSVDISTQAGSNAALDTIDGALSFIAEQRSAMGAVMNRFESTISNLSNVVENTEAARSRITDADFAKETAALSKAQVLQQASMAMLAQANQAPQSVLSLLR